MKMRYLTSQNFQIYLETSVTYFHTKDFKWSVCKDTLTTCWDTIHSYLLKRETAWNQLKRPETTWN